MRRAPTAVLAVLACACWLLGALNELVEFLFGLNNAELHAGGLENTGWDLAFNLAGAVVGAWIVHDERARERVLVSAHD